MPHDKNPADALTKVEGAHFAPMAKLLNTSKFCIQEEAEELLERKQTKEILDFAVYSMDELKEHAVGKRIVAMSSATEIMKSIA